MNYLFVPKDVLAEKIADLGSSVDIFKNHDNDPTGKAFHDLLKAHLNDFQKLQNYTLPPPGIFKHLSSYAGISNDSKM